MTWIPTVCGLVVGGGVFAWNEWRSRILYGPRIPGGARMRWEQRRAMRWEAGEER